MTNETLAFFIAEVTINKGTVAARSVAGLKTTGLNDDDVDSIDLDTKPNEDLAIILPMMKTIWKNSNVEQNLVLCFWMLSGAFRWMFKVRDDRTSGILRVAYPRTFTAPNVSCNWSGKENPDSWLRQQAMKETIATMFSKEGGLCWMSMV